MHAHVDGWQLPNQSESKIPCTSHTRLINYVKTMVLNSHSE